MDIAVNFWVDEICSNRDDISEEQRKIFINHLYAKLGDPCELTQLQFQAGSLHNDPERCYVVDYALRAANIDYTITCNIDVYICCSPFDNNQCGIDVYKRTYDQSVCTTLGIVIEEAKYD
jgi:hypothetical protein